MRGSTGLLALALLAAPTLAVAQDEAYPLCRNGVTDHCQNPGEGGAPGRSRASDVKGGMSEDAGMMGMHHRMHHGMKGSHAKMHRKMHRRHHH